MGSGKSSVGRELPALLSLPGGPFDFIDLDEFIVESEGMSVNEIFARDGESGFRSIERHRLETLVEQYDGRNLILALGGGTAVFNPELVHSRTICIYLSASVDTLANRLASDTSRPLLAGTSAKTGGPSHHDQKGASAMDAGSSLDNLSGAAAEKVGYSLNHLANASKDCDGNDGVEKPEKELRSRIERLYAAREATYRSVAHHIVATDGISVSAIATRVAALFI